MVLAYFTVLGHGAHHYPWNLAALYPKSDMVSIDILDIFIGNLVLQWL